MTWDTEYGPFNRTCWLNNVVPRHRRAVDSIGRGIGDVKPPHIGRRHEWLATSPGDMLGDDRIRFGHPAAGPLGHPAVRRAAGDRLHSHRAGGRRDPGHSRDCGVEVGYAGLTLV